EPATPCFESAGSPITPSFNVSTGICDSSSAICWASKHSTTRDGCSLGSNSCRRFTRVSTILQLRELIEAATEPLFRAFSRRQVPQQPAEGLLVGVVVLPVREIADVSRAPQVRSPGLRCIHHGVINADWEQHRTFLPVFAFACCVDLALDPATLDRGL